MKQSGSVVLKLSEHQNFLEGLLKCIVLDLIFLVSDSAGLCWSPKICTSDMSLCNSNAAAPGITLWKSLIYIQITPIKKCRDKHEQELIFRNSDWVLPFKNLFKEHIEVIFLILKPSLKIWFKKMVFLCLTKWLICKCEAEHLIWNVAIFHSDHFYQGKIWKNELYSSNFSQCKKKYPNSSLHGFFCSHIIYFHA